MKNEKLNKNKVRMIATNRITWASSLSEVVLRQLQPSGLPKNVLQLVNNQISVENQY